MENVPSGRPGKLEVRNNQIKFLLLEHGHRIRRAPGRLNFMVSLAQDCSSRFQHGIILIDQKDAPLPYLFHWLLGSAWLCLPGRLVGHFDQERSPARRNITDPDRATVLRNYSIT